MKKNEVRWDDLETFGVIAEGLKKQKKLQQIAEEPLSAIGGARMLYLRLGRLERALGHRLVDRRPWGRQAYLTPAGEKLADYVADLISGRQKLQEAFEEPEVPVLRIAAHATLISTLLPAVIEEYQRRNRQADDFHVELTQVQSYAEALRIVDEGRADVGLHLVFPNFDDVPMPRNVVSESLGETDTLVIFSEKHELAGRAEKDNGAAVGLEELLDECVITRGYVDHGLLPEGGRGRRVRVPHFLDKISYVRVGIGVSLYPRLAFELLGPVAGVKALPLKPAVQSSLTLLTPLRRTRPLEKPAAGFLKELRKLSSSLAKSG